MSHPVQTIFQLAFISSWTSGMPIHQLKPLLLFHWLYPAPSLSLALKTSSLSSAAGAWGAVWSGCWRTAPNPKVPLKIQDSAVSRTPWPFGQLFKTQVVSTEHVFLQATPVLGGSQHPCESNTTRNHAGELWRGKVICKTSFNSHSQSPEQNLNPSPTPTCPKHDPLISLAF